MRNYEKKISANVVTQHFTWYTFESLQERCRPLQISQKLVQVLVTEFVCLLLEEAGHSQGDWTEVIKIGAELVYTPTVAFVGGVAALTFKRAVACEVFAQRLLAETVILAH